MVSCAAPIWCSPRRMLDLTCLLPVAHIKLSTKSHISNTVEWLLRVSQLAQEHRHCHVPAFAKLSRAPPSLPSVRADGRLGTIELSCFLRHDQPPQDNHVWCVSLIGSHSLDPPRPVTLRPLSYLYFIPSSRSQHRLSWRDPKLFTSADK